MLCAGCLRDSFHRIRITILRPFVTLLGSTERLMPHVLPYAAVTLCGTAAMTFKLFFEYMVRTDGNSRIGLVMSMTGLLLNLLLDYVLVGVFSLGTFGAALGTVLSIFCQRADRSYLFSAAQSFCASAVLIFNGPFCCVRASTASAIC